MDSRSGADGPINMEQLFAELERLGDELTVYIPSGESVSPLTQVDLIDEEIESPADDTTYLLEVGLIKDVMRVWKAWRDGAEPSITQACEAVSYYARHDAYQPVS